MKVYQAINAVQQALVAEGIGKDRRNQQQGYNFRGIDDIYNAVSPILAKSGLCILPRVLSRDCVERQTQKGGTLFYVTVEVEFDFVATEDGTKHIVKTYGEAMDSADKATNKAMSAAYKYAIMQAFAIPTEGDNDADATTHEVAPRRVAPAPNPTPKAAPAGNVATPTKMEGREGAWQLTVTADPGTDIAAWADMVVETCKIALEQTHGADDVMAIFKVNRNIFDRMKADASTHYDEMMAAFKAKKESFKEAA
jgi:hypothetical protein